LSWTLPHKQAASGEIKIKVYDEEGFSALKKAQRNGEDLSKIKELKQFELEHQSNYAGFYIQSEYVAIVSFAVIFYFAQSLKSDIKQ
jgi:translocon-associated protein subunit delta